MADEKMEKQNDLYMPANRILDQVRNMTEPTDQVVFDRNHRVSLYYCTSADGEYSYIEFRRGDHVVTRYGYGYQSVFDMAKNYLDNEAAKTADPLQLAYYTYCYAQIGLEFDELIGLFHNRNERVALITLRDTPEDGVIARYVCAGDDPESILTFTDRKTALAWYKKNDEDIRVFTVPVNYVAGPGYKTREHSS